MCASPPGAQTWHLSFSRRSAGGHQSLHRRDQLQSQTFVWTADPARVLAAIARGKQALEVNPTQQRASWTPKRSKATTLSRDLSRNIDDLLKDPIAYLEWGTGEKAGPRENSGICNEDAAMFAPLVAKQKTKSAELQRPPIAAQRHGQPAPSPVQLLQRRIGNQALMRFLAQRGNEPAALRLIAQNGTSGAPDRLPHLTSVIAIALRLMRDARVSAPVAELERFQVRCDSSSLPAASSIRKLTVAALSLPSRGDPQNVRASRKNWTPRSPRPFVLRLLASFKSILNGEVFWPPSGMALWLRIWNSETSNVASCAAHPSVPRGPSLLGTTTHLSAHSLKRLPPIIEIRFTKYL